MLICLAELHPLFHQPILLHLQKTEAAAQAEQWAVDSMQRCLVEGQDGMLKALKYEATLTTIKAAADGKIVEATVNGYFVATKEAGQGKSDDAEAAWVEREQEVARVKAMLAKVTREIKDSQRDIFDICDLGQGMNREWIEKDRRQVEELYARNREERQKEKQELKWRIVAGEVLGYIRRVKCPECQWHTKWRIEAGEAVGRVWRTRCEECRWPTHMEVLREMQFAREDRVSGATVQGGFEAAVTAVQCGRSAELRWSALVGIAQATQNWRDAAWELHMGIAQEMKLHEEEEQMKIARRMKIDEEMEINEEKRIDEDIMKNTKEILKKMIRNKELMKREVDKDKEARKKTMASKSESKKKNKGKGRSKRE